MLSMVSSTNSRSRIFFTTLDEREAAVVLSNLIGIGMICAIYMFPCAVDAAAAATSNCRSEDAADSGLKVGMSLRVLSNLSD